MSKNKEYGLSGSNGRHEYMKYYYKKDVAMFFDYKEDCFGINIFNEVTLLNFVAQSYAKSALELYKKVAEYDSEDAKEEKDTTYFYLPAKFCFRQYLELKLKCLIMICKEKNFKIYTNLVHY